MANPCGPVQSTLPIEYNIPHPWSKILFVSEKISCTTKRKKKKKVQIQAEAYRFWIEFF